MRNIARRSIFTAAPLAIVGTALSASASASTTVAIARGNNSATAYFKITRSGMYDFVYDVATAARGRNNGFARAYLLRNGEHVVAEFFPHQNDSAVTRRIYCPAGSYKMNISMASAQVNVDYNAGVYARLQTA